MTREEVKLKLDELGVKYDKRLKLEKLMEIYEKNGQNLKDNAGEQEQIEVEAKKDDNQSVTEPCPVTENKDSSFNPSEVKEFIKKYDKRRVAN